MSKNEQFPEYDYNTVPIKKYVKEKQEIPSHYGYGVRHVQLIIFFLCLTVNFIARGHMGVTVVAMTNIFKENEVTMEINVTVQCLHPKGTNDTNILDEVYNNITIESIGNITLRNVNVEEANSTNKSYKTFNWPKSTQEMVLGSFFLGYCIMTFPIGLMVQRWGGKMPLQLALFVNGIISILTPWLTNWGGWKALCVCRVIQGLSQAGLYPSIQNLLAKWVPASERATLSSYVYTGITVGTVVAFQISGYLGESRWGWPATFWAIGVICLVLFVFLTIFGAATPSQHKTISEEEKSYIMGRADDGNIRKPKTPWKAIITSRPMWGTLATHIGSGSSFVFFFTQVPSYIHYIFGIDVKSSGVLSSLPYVASFFTSITFGLTSDYLTNNNILSIRTARRIFNSISQVGIAVSLVCASFTSSTVVAVTCLVVAMGCHMGIHVGWMVNHIDLAPNFSGTLMMLGNTMMNLLSVLLPVLVSHVVTDVTNQIQWRIMFCIVAAVALSTNAIFVLLMSAETQPWNDIDQNETCIEDSKPEDEKEKQ